MTLAFLDVSSKKTHNKQQVGTKSICTKERGGGGGGGGVMTATNMCSNSEVSGVFPPPPPHLKLPKFEHIVGFFS